MTINNNYKLVKLKRIEYSMELVNMRANICVLWSRIENSRSPGDIDKPSSLSSPMKIETFSSTLLSDKICEVNE